MRKEIATLFMEYFSHYLLCSLILGVGGIAPTLGVILIGGPVLNSTFPALTGSIDGDTVLYGIGLNVLFHGLTRGWWIQQIVAAWTETQALHDDYLSNIQA